MKAVYKGRPADVWEISQTNERPAWVKAAFEENYLCWLDNHLRILMSGLNPSLGANLKPPRLVRSAAVLLAITCMRLGI